MSTLLKNKVKLIFSQGARLADLDKLFDPGMEGNKWRAIDVHEGDAIDESAPKALIRSGVEYDLEAQSDRKARSARRDGALEPLWSVENATVRPPPLRLAIALIARPTQLLTR